MTDQDHVYLQGGPDGLPERIVPRLPKGAEVKIPYLGGYEHFRATSRRTDTSEGPLTVYEWYERTEVAG